MGKALFVKIRERTDSRLTIESLPVPETLLIGAALTAGVVMIIVALAPVGVVLIIAATVANMLVRHRVYVIDRTDGRLVVFAKRRVGVAQPEAGRSFLLTEIEAFQIVAADSGSSAGAARLLLSVVGPGGTQPLEERPTAVRAKLSRLKDLLDPYLRAEDQSVS